MTQSHTNSVPLPRRVPKRRKPETRHLRTNIALGFPTARRWHATIERALNKPRSKSTAKELTDLHAEIAGLLGDAIAPDYVPRPGKPRCVGWEVTMPDGSVRTTKDSRRAARAAGLKISSMKTMLSVGGGKLVRKVTEKNHKVSVYKVRRILADEEISWSW